MDEFFEMSPGSILWMEEATLMINHHQSHSTAFVPYTNMASQPRDRQPSYCRNVHKRMLQFWKNRSECAPVTLLEYVPDGGRGNVHKIMGERMRRQKHRQGYQALHELLPAGTKGDKISILETATKEIGQIHLQIQQLMNDDGKSEMQASPSEIAEIKLKVTNPASGIDSMLQVLKCVKAMDSTLLAIKSQFSDNELAAVLELKTNKIRAADVEVEVNRTLHEAERKLRDNHCL